MTQVRFEIVAFEAGSIFLEEGVRLLIVPLLKSETRSRNRRLERSYKDIRGLYTTCLTTTIDLEGSLDSAFR